MKEFVQQKRGWLIGGGIGVVVITLVVILVLSLTVWAVPHKKDFQQLNDQRSAAEASIDAYDPILTDYAAKYQKAYLEDYSAEAKQEIRDKYEKKFDEEMQSSEQRLSTMNSSLALKNKKVEAAYQGFAKDYQAALDYVSQYKTTATGLVESISGVCKKVTKLDVQDDDYAKNFVAASDNCLAALAEAKKHTTSSAKTMVTSLEKMYRNLQDNFKAVLDEKDKNARIALESIALFSVLGVNSQLASIQLHYQKAESKEGEAITKTLSESSQALKQALEQAASQVE